MLQFITTLGKWNVLQEEWMPVFDIHLLKDFPFPILFAFSPITIRMFKKFSKAFMTASIILSTTNQIEWLGFFCLFFHFPGYIPLSPMNYYSDKYTLCFAWLQLIIELLKSQFQRGTVISRETALHGGFWSQTAWIEIPYLLLAVVYQVKC